MRRQVWDAAGRVPSGAEQREVVEQKMRDLGYTWEWLPDGCLRATTPVLPAVREVQPGRRPFSISSSLPTGAGRMNGMILPRQFS